MSLEIKKRGLNSVIVDRGMTSFENLKMILSLEMEIIAGVKKTAVLCDEFIAKVKRDEIYCAQNMIELENTTVFAQAFDYLKGKLIIVYNPALEVVKKDMRLRKGEDVPFDIGYSLIFHNTKNETKEVVKKYYNKEIIERAFKHMKGVLNLRPIRVWLEGHVKGHMMVCYLAYAILALMNYKLKKLKVSASGSSIR
jgi:transposase